MADSQVSTGLEFSFPAVLEELNHMRDSVHRFLEPESSAIIIPRWIAQLRQFQLPDRQMDTVWEIPRNEPIRTVRSESINPFGAPLVGEISSCWRIQAEKGTKNKPIRPVTFRLPTTGLGTTIARLKTADNQNTVAEWHFDVKTDENAPGGPLHLQIQWDAANNLGKGELDIPRFSSLVVLPMDAIAFLLGELFQQRWTRHVSGRISAVEWAKHLSKRTSQALQWHLTRLKDSSSIPWIAFRHASLPADTFLN